MHYSHLFCLVPTSFPTPPLLLCPRFSFDDARILVAVVHGVPIFILSSAQAGVSYLSARIARSRSPTLTSGFDAGRTEQASPAVGIWRRLSLGSSDVEILLGMGSTQIAVARRLVPNSFRSYSFDSSVLPCLDGASSGILLPTEVPRRPLILTGRHLRPPLPRVHPPLSRSSLTRRIGILATAHRSATPSSSPPFCAFSEGITHLSRSSTSSS
ncbi:hypothetical protein DFH09DRAFT_1173769 [Mycena vulgaris]|nr:hypothetical protein DFH09DRAFT_1173769 [Mycena vulgaris]